MTGLWYALAVATMVALVTRMSLTPTGRRIPLARAGRWYMRQCDRAWLLCHPLGPIATMTPAPLPLAQAGAAPVAAREVPAPPPPSGAGASPDMPVAALFREFAHRPARLARPDGAIFVTGTGRVVVATAESLRQTTRLEVAGDEWGVPAVRPYVLGSPAARLAASAGARDRLECPGWDSPGVRRAQMAGAA